MQSAPEQAGDTTDAVGPSTALKAHSARALQHTQPQPQTQTQLTGQDAKEAEQQEGEGTQLALALQPSQEPGEAMLLLLLLSCAAVMCAHRCLQLLTLVRLHSRESWC